MTNWQDFFSSMLMNCRERSCEHAVPMETFETKCLRPIKKIQHTNEISSPRNNKRSTRKKKRYEYILDSHYRLDRGKKTAQIELNKLTHLTRVMSWSKTATDQKSWKPIEAKQRKFDHNEPHSHKEAERTPIDYGFTTRQRGCSRNVRGNLPIPRNTIKFALSGTRSWGKHR
jgi:hypothetical protein